MSTETKRNMSANWTKFDLIRDLLHSLETEDSYSSTIQIKSVKEYESNLKQYLKLDMLLSWLQDEAMFPSSSDRNTKDWKTFTAHLINAEVATYNLARYLPLLSGSSAIAVPVSKVDLVWLEDKLTNRAVALGTNLLNSVDTDGALGPYKNVSMLPTIVREKQMKCAHLRKELELKTTKNAELSLRLRNTMLDSLTGLENYISQQVLILQPEVNRTQAHRLILKADALVLKIKCQRMEILCETYNCRAVSALKSIREYVNEETKQLHEEIEASKNLLDSYESLGPRFKRIVAEFNQLQKEIRDKEWNLEKFATYQSK